MTTCPFNAYQRGRARLQQRARTASLSVPILPGYERHHWSYRQAHWKDVIVIPTALHHRIHTFIDYDPEAFCFRTLFGELLETRAKHLDYLSRCLPGAFTRPDGTPPSDG